MSALDLAVSSVTGSPTSAVQLLPHPRDPGPGVLEPGAAALQADRRSVVSAPRAVQRLLRLLDGRRAAGAPRQLTAGRTGEQLGPPGAVQHAQHPAVGSEEADQGRREQPGAARVLVAPVHHLDRRPTGPVAGAVRREQVAPRQRLQGRAGARQDAGHPGPARSLDGDVAGVPGGRLLLLVGLVVLVEHDDGGQVGHRRPGRGPGADDRRAGCAERPTAGVRCHRHPRPAQAGAHGGGERRRRAQDEGVAERGGRRGHVHEVGGRWEAEHGPRPRERAREQLVVRGRDGTGRRGRGELGDVAVRGGRPEERRRTTRPPPGRPPRQVDELRRRAEAAALGEGPQLHARGRLDVRFDDPAADPPAVERDADHVADAHLVPDGVRDQVVERLVDRRHVRQDANDERLRRCQGAGDGWLRHAVGRHLRRAVRAEARPGASISSGPRRT